MVDVEGSLEVLASDVDGSNLGLFLKKERFDWPKLGAT
jgi:hypothetical protein